MSKTSKHSESKIAIGSSLLDHIPHGFFTRNGGVSKGIYSTLNLGLGSKDEPRFILENRERVRAHIGGDKLIIPHQIHSNICHTLYSSEDMMTPLQGDALVTRCPKVAIGVLSADCTPILCADLKNGVIGAAHAGWRGATGGVIEAMIDAMCEEGGDRKEILAAIGPCIQMPNYEVGEAFYDDICSQHKHATQFFEQHKETQNWHFNLSAFCADALVKCDITVQTLPNCTYSEKDQFFSYRRNQHQNEPDYGRQGSFIMLP